MSSRRNSIRIVDYPNQGRRSFLFGKIRLQGFQKRDVIAPGAAKRMDKSSTTFEPGWLEIR
jgi:hypothetical protein